MHAASLRRRQEKGFSLNVRTKKGGDEADAPSPSLWAGGWDSVRGAGAPPATPWTA